MRQASPTDIVAFATPVSLAVGFAVLTIWQKTVVAVLGFVGALVAFGVRIVEDWKA